MILNILELELLQVEICTRDAQKVKVIVVVKLWTYHRNVHTYH